LSAEIAAQYLLFCVDDRTSPLLRGPVAEKSPECNFSIDGIGMWIGEPGAYTRLVQFHRGPNPKVRGLAPGRHRLRAFPDDLVFEPAEFDVPAAGAKVVVRWGSR
jgi:hypothetical protein